MFGGPHRAALRVRFFCILGVLCIPWGEQQDFERELFMHLIERNDQIERIFLPWRFPLGKAYEAYKGHVYRVLNFACAALEVSEASTEVYGKNQAVEDRIAVAACFHDVGIWLDKTVDYLDPSKRHASEWLRERLLEEWESEVALMIEYHHKQTRYTGEHEVLVEAFRRADLVDVSLGLVRFGIPGKFVRDVKRAFPNHGFHLTLVRKVTPYMLTHPWNPLPMFRK